MKSSASHVTPCASRGGPLSRRPMADGGGPTSKSEAKILGLSWYIGRFCSRGHFKRYVKTGHCIECHRHSWSETKEQKSRRRFRLIMRRQRLKKAHPARFAFSGAKRRSTRDGREFTIKLSDIKVPDRCPILGIPLFYTEGRQSDNSPSIDRIDSNRGYTPDNIVVISWRANRLKGSAS